MRHVAQFFLVGDYRCDLLDLLQGLADADPGLIAEDWVAEAVTDMAGLCEDGRGRLVRNYGRKVADPIPFETVGAPSRFPTHQWLSVRRRFGLSG